MKSLKESLLDDDNTVLRNAKVRAEYITQFKKLFTKDLTCFITPGLNDTRQLDEQSIIDYFLRSYDRSSDQLKVDKISLDFNEYLIDVINNYSGPKINVSQEISLGSLYRSGIEVDLDDVKLENIISKKSTTKTVLLHSCTFSKKTLDKLPDNSLIDVASDCFYDHLTETLTDKGNHKYQFSVSSAQKILRTMFNTPKIFIK